MTARRNSPALVRSLALGGALVVAFVACVERAPNDERSLSTSRQRLVEAGFNGASLGEKELVLTFDDGPAPTTTTAIAAYLKNRPSGSISATFFVNGACVATTTLPGNKACVGGPTTSATTILGQIASNGHTIGNHGTTHRNFVTEVPRGERVQEISETDTRIGAFVGYRRYFFRAPYGAWGGASPTPFDTLSVSLMNRYTGPVGWDIGATDTDCWQQGWTTRQCGDLYVDQIRTAGRGIVRMHDPAGNHPNTNIDDGTGNTFELVKYIVPILEDEGFTFKALAEVPAIAAALPPCHASCISCSGPNANQCTACPGGTYLRSGACEPCTICGASSFQTAACTPTTDTVCTPCDATCATCAGASSSQCRSCTEEHFLSPSPTGACHACKVCGSGSFQSAACTATTDAVCGKCHPSCTACAGPELADCGKCPEGFHIEEGVCVACTKCRAGTYETGPCSTFADRTCAECPAGTSSMGGTKECTPCFEGSFADRPGSSSCTDCSECDDEDRCTTDTCDVVRGCGHAALSNCTDAPIALEPPSTKPPAPPLSSGVGESSGGGCNEASTTPKGSCSLLACVLAGAALRRRRARRRVS